MLKKTFISSLLPVLLVILSCGLAQATSVTIATFADPAANSTTPLFTVDWTNNTVVGEWADGIGNLDLVFPESGHPFEDAWFSMDILQIVSETTWGGYTYGITSAGQINFYAQGTTTPLLTASFEQAMVSRAGLGADDFFSENVTFTGSQITGALYNEQFSFSFANVQILTAVDGFTATAAFTSSAVPEPATTLYSWPGGP